MSMPLTREQAGAAGRQPLRARPSGPVLSGRRKAWCSAYASMDGVIVEGIL